MSRKSKSTDVAEALASQAKEHKKERKQDAMKYQAKIDALIAENEELKRRDLNGDVDALVGPLRNTSMDASSSTPSSSPDKWLSKATTKHEIECKWTRESISFIT